MQSSLLLNYLSKPAQIYKTENDMQSVKMYNETMRQYFYDLKFAIN